jgi:hypothetical protein
VSKGKTPIVQSWEAEQKHRIQKHWINTSDEEEDQEEEQEALSNHWTCSIHANMPFALLSKLLTTDCPYSHITPNFFSLRLSYTNCLRFNPFQGVGTKINIWFKIFTIKTSNATKPICGKEKRKWHTNLCSCMYLTLGSRSSLKESLK